MFIRSPGILAYKALRKSSLVRAFRASHNRFSTATVWRPPTAHFPHLLQTQRPHILCSPPRLDLQSQLSHCTYRASHSPRCRTGIHSRCCFTLAGFEHILAWPRHEQVCDVAAQLSTLPYSLHRLRETRLKLEKSEGRDAHEDNVRLCLMAAAYGPLTRGHRFRQT
jgi:hypothetical protein